MKALGVLVAITLLGVLAVVSLGGKTKLETGMSKGTEVDTTTTTIEHGIPKLPTKTNVAAVKKKGEKKKEKKSALDEFSALAIGKMSKGELMLALTKLARDTDNILSTLTAIEEYGDDSLIAKGILINRLRQDDPDYAEELVTELQQTFEASVKDRNDLRLIDQFILVAAIGEVKTSAVQEWLLDQLTSVQTKSKLPLLSTIVKLETFTVEEKRKALEYARTLKDEKISKFVSRMEAELTNL